LTTYRPGERVEIFEKNQAGAFVWQPATVVDIRREGVIKRIDKIQVKTPEGRLFFFYGEDSCIRRPAPPRPVVRRKQLCNGYVGRGMGVGECGRDLDPYGNCDRAYDHV
jgi:hypothetical protein